MKKRVFGRKFSRAQKGRHALLRSLVREFVLRGEINTTKPRAKYIKPVIDRLVTISKKQTLEGHRRLEAFFAHDGEAVSKLEDAARNFVSIISGYSTVVALGVRRGDAAPMVRIAWKKVEGALEKASNVNKGVEEQDEK